MNVLEEKTATPFPSQSPPHPAQDRDTGIGSHFSSLGLLGFVWWQNISQRCQSIFTTQKCLNSSYWLTFSPFVGFYSRNVILDTSVCLWRGERGTSSLARSLHSSEESNLGFVRKSATKRLLSSPLFLLCPLHLLNRRRMCPSGFFFLCFLQHYDLLFSFFLPAPAPNSLVS